VVGVNTAKIKEEAVEGLSFAVPMPYACTVLKLLEAGGDPSPPAHLVDFARDDNDEQTLVIARSRLPAGTLDLRVGDEILAVTSPEREVANSTDLVDALRGRLDRVSLRVRRDGRDIEVAGRLPAASRITERRGLTVSGALVAEAEPLTLGLIADNPALMVHYVAPGSEAESAGLAAFDLIMSADGEPVASLDVLAQRARAAAASGRPVELMLLRIGSETQEEFFIYQRRLLPVEELQAVGPGGR
jgi:S1-C subfamily serine protease